MSNFPDNIMDSKFDPSSPIYVGDDYLSPNEIAEIQGDEAYDKWVDSEYEKRANGE